MKLHEDLLASLLIDLNVINSPYGVSPMTF